jgi:hypothetical protein
MLSYQYAEVFSRIAHKRFGSLEELMMPKTFATQLKIIKSSDLYSNQLLIPNEMAVP